MLEKEHRVLTPPLPTSLSTGGPLQKELRRGSVRDVSPLDSDLDFYRRKNSIQCLRFHQSSLLRLSKMVLRLLDESLTFCQFHSQEATLSARRLRPCATGIIFLSLQSILQSLDSVKSCNLHFLWILTTVDTMPSTSNWR